MNKKEVAVIVDFEKLQRVIYNPKSYIWMPIKVGVIIKSKTKNILKLL